MMHHERPAAPEQLARQGTALSERYAAKRTENPAHAFRWPDGLRQVVGDALATMTDHHCAYCDFNAITAAGEEQIDHFRPKSRPQFYLLVAEWTNLFFCCSACNKAKLDKWDDLLLKPDESDYEFLRYFSYRTDSGEIVPNPGASALDQQRARCTISIFGHSCPIRGSAALPRTQAARPVPVPRPSGRYPFPKRPTMKAVSA